MINKDGGGGQFFHFIGGGDIELMGGSPSSPTREKSVDWHTHMYADWIIWHSHIYKTYWIDALVTGWKMIIMTMYFQVLY